MGIIEVRLIGPPNDMAEVIDAIGDVLDVTWHARVLSPSGHDLMYANGEIEVAANMKWWPVTPTHSMDLTERQADGRG